MFEFTWLRFAYTIVNFLILVAILYRLLHKPLLRVLEKRQQDIADARAEAERKTDEAQSAREAYESKLAAIEEERDLMLAGARRKAEESREEILVKARAEAERAVANLKRDWERQRRDAMATLQDEIVGLSLSLSQRIVEELADERVEAALMERLHRELEAMASVDSSTRAELMPADGTVHVVSASPLEPAEKERLGELIRTVADRPVELDFDTDESLVAGARVEFSSQAVDATLAGIVSAVRQEFEELSPAPPEEEEE
jgi:F-type H+-transporting ATPase subunit b